MARYAIIETEAGLAVTEVQHEGRPEDEALRFGGVVVDPGPYDRYEDAYDAMLSLEGGRPRGRPGLGVREGLPCRGCAASAAHWLA